MVTEVQIEELLDAMSLWYDGYCFDDGAETHVFSTWSVLRFFADRKARLQPYWTAEEGLGLPRLLKASLSRLPLPKVVGEAAAGSFCITYTQFIQSSLINPEANPYSLLFQTGYLTLTRPFVNGGDIYLNCPNRELSLALANLVAARLFQGKVSYTPETQGKIAALLSGLDERQILSYFNELFAALPYEHYPVTGESMVVALIDFHLRGAGFVPRHEVSESKGQPDLIVDLKEQGLSVVMEFKYEAGNSDAALDRKLEEAVTQIKSRDYGNTADSEKTIARFALVFSGDQRLRQFVRASLVDVRKRD